MDRRIIIIPENIPQGFDTEKSRVRYGKIEKFSYDSVIAGREMTGDVLLPYNLNYETGHPVLFLYHGLGANGEWADSRKGCIKWIVGNMLSEDKISDMIVVMPDIMYSQDHVVDFYNFGWVLLRDLIPYIKKTYPISMGKKRTAIAGLSIGGKTALYDASFLRQYYEFCFVGALSPSPLLLPENGCSGWISDKTNFKLGTGREYLTFIANGENDSVTKGSPEYYSNTLTENGVNNTFAILPKGGHDWDAFKKCAYVFLSYDFFRKY